MTTDQKINGLRNGGSVLISESNGIKVFAERSGDGKTLRFVRESGNTQTVFKICRY
jgi:hypothetical protein